MSKKDSIQTAYKKLSGKYGSRHGKAWAKHVKTKRGGKLRNIGKLSRDHRP